MHRLRSLLPIQMQSTLGVHSTRILDQVTAGRSVLAGQHFPGFQIHAARKGHILIFKPPFSRNTPTPSPWKVSFELRSSVRLRTVRE